MNAFIEIALPGQSSRRYPICGTQLSVGRSPDCDIALPGAGRLQPQHLSLRPRADGIELSLVDARSAPLLFHGKSLTSCTVPWEEEVFTAGIRFKPERPGGDGAGRRAALAALPVVAALFFAGATFLPFKGDGSAVFSLTGPQPPALWEEAVACTQPAAAEHRAREAERAALAKMQRYRFEASDGVQALRMLQEAARCYADGGRKREAAQAAKRFEAWKQRLQQDYHGGLLRLRLALQKRDREEVLREVRGLRALLGHRDGDYLSWLGELQRKLTRKEGK